MKMNQTVEYLIQHGAVVQLVTLLIEQVDLPFLLAILLFAGGMEGAAKLHWAPPLIRGADRGL